MNAWTPSSARVAVTARAHLLTTTVVPCARAAMTGKASAVSSTGVDAMTTSSATTAARASESQIVWTHRGRG